MLLVAIYSFNRMTIFVGMSTAFTISHRNCLNNFNGRAKVDERYVAFFFYSSYFSKICLTVRIWPIVNRPGINDFPVDQILLKVSLLKVLLVHVLIFLLLRSFIPLPSCAILFHDILFLENLTRKIAIIKKFTQLLFQCTHKKL